MTTGIAADHLARLQGSLKASNDRIYELERRLRVKQTNLRPKREDITWSAPALPTSDLYAGRRVYATGLTNTLFGPNRGRRLYVYDPQPREGAFGDGPRGWRLVNPISFSYRLVSSVPVLAGGVNKHFDAIGLDFGIAPVMCDVVITAVGCVETATAGTEAIADIARGTDSAIVLRRSCLWLDTTAARPTMTADFRELRAVGDRIYYVLNFETSAQTTTFVGESTNPPDAWTIRVEIT